MNSTAEERVRDDPESKPSLDVEPVRHELDDEKYAVYGNAPAGEHERSGGLVGQWGRMNDWLLLEWSVESRGCVELELFCGSYDSKSL